MGGGSGALSASCGLATAAGSYDEFYVEHGAVGEVFVVECVVYRLGGKMSGPLDWCGDGGEFGVDDGRELGTVVACDREFGRDVNPEIGGCLVGADR